MSETLRSKSDKCDCGHERWLHSKRECCEGHIDRDPSWHCKCEAFITPEEADARALAMPAAENEVSLSGAWWEGGALQSSYDVARLRRDAAALLLALKRAAELLDCQEYPEDCREARGGMCTACRVYQGSRAVIDACSTKAAVPQPAEQSEARHEFYPQPNCRCSACRTARAESR